MTSPSDDAASDQQSTTALWSGEAAGKTTTEAVTSADEGSDAAAVPTETALDQSVEGESASALVLAPSSEPQETSTDDGPTDEATTDSSLDESSAQEIDGDVVEHVEISTESVVVLPDEPIEEDDSAADVVDDALDELDPEVLAEDSPVDLVEELNAREQLTARELFKAELVVKAKRDRYEDLARQVNEARENRDALVRARDSLDAWLKERKRSLSTLLLEHVERELARVAADETRMRNFGKLKDFSGLARQLRRAFVINMWAALATASVITLVLFVIALVLRQFALNMPILELSPWRYAVLFIALLLLGTFQALFPYHRGFARMRRELDQQLAWGRHAMASIERIRQDQSRLSELRPQLEERLEFYGSVLQESWRIPTASDAAASERALAESLPANLQVAMVTETSEGTWNRLLQRFTAQQFKTGLRREAADRLLAEASTLHGLDAARVDLAFLDKDNLQRDLRLVLMQYATDPQVLERLGRERTIEIAEAIQRALSPQDDNRPEISLTNVGDLDGLVVGNDLLAEWRSVRNSWDDFMAAILEDPSALSLLAFSGRGQADGDHHRFESVAVAPERVRSRASRRVAWADIRSDVVTGTEMATRIDITDPIDVDRVALFDEPDSVGIEAEVDGPWNDDAPPEQRVAGFM
jgi:hypothetical protein